MKRFRSLLLAAAFALVAAATASSVAQAKPSCICIDLYAPVRCSDGVVYSNSCFAACAGATGCVPIGPSTGPVTL